MADELHDRICKLTEHFAAADQQQPDVLSAAASPANLDSFDICEAIAALFPTLSSSDRKRLFHAFVSGRERRVDCDVQEDDKKKERVEMSAPTSPMRGGPSTDATAAALSSSISFRCAAAAAGVTGSSNVLPSMGGLRLKSPSTLDDDDAAVFSQHKESEQQKRSDETAPPATYDGLFLPYILLNDRCASDMLPWMSSIPNSISDIVGGLPASGNGHAWSLYADAEASLRKGRSGSEWSDAVQLFEEAAVLFAAETTPQHAMSANCLVRSADCLRCLRDVDQMATMLERAGAAYARVLAEASPRRRAEDDVDVLRVDSSPQLNYIANASVQCFFQAVFVARTAGRAAKAAKMCRKGAEAAVVCGKHDDALSLLYRACDLYANDLSMAAEARAVMFRAVTIAVMDMSDLALAIDALERLANVSMPEEQPLVLFRAMLCRLACIPGVTGNDTNDAMNDCEYALDQYTDLCVALCGGKENVCLKQMLRGVMENDPVRVENAAESYISTHTLEEWVPPMFHMVWHRTVERLAHRTEHLRDAVNAS